MSALCSPASNYKGSPHSYRRSSIFRSCIFMPCDLVPHFLVLHFPVLHFQRPRVFMYFLLCVYCVYSVLFFCLVRINKWMNELSISLCYGLFPECCTWVLPRRSVTAMPAKKHWLIDWLIEYKSELTRHIQCNSKCYSVFRLWQCVTKRCYCISEP